MKAFRVTPSRGTKAEGGYVPASVCTSAGAAGPHTLKWRYHKDSSGSYDSDCGWVRAVTWEPLPTLGQAVDLPALPFTTGGDHVWYARRPSIWDSNWVAYSSELGARQSNWMQTTVEGAGTFSFWWKSPSTDVFSTLRFEIDGQPQATLEGDYSTWQQQSYTITGSGTHTLKWTFTRSEHAEWYGSGYVDRVQWTGALPAGSAPPLRFYVDGVLRSSCTEASWQNFSYSITGSGPHTLRWLFKRSSSDWSGTGSVDYVQWTGYVEQPPAPEEPTPEDWRILRYVYDAGGRRIEKKYDDTTQVKYVYDGQHCIAEYDGSNQLLRRYIYGQCIDEPIAMIESSGSYAGTYFYHFDGLGSVVALTSGNVGSMGNTVEVYEYDVYGRVGALDADHPNRFMFTGREYDKETGLYYYRARYYNPQIGRFLQTDPMGYKDGMNSYAYCHNRPSACADPTGLGVWYGFLAPGEDGYVEGKLTFARFIDGRRWETKGKRGQPLISCCRERRWGGRVAVCRG